MMKLVTPVLCLLVCLTTNLTQAVDQPNIVVFLVDDMGLMDTSVPFITSAEGKAERHPLNDFYRTPSMKRLADQGIRLSHFYAMSVCSPTRASILSGQTSARHYTTQFISPEKKNTGGFGPPAWKWKGFTKDDNTFPKLLQKAGYRTIHAGKAHFGPNNSLASDPTNLGFDINIAGCAYGQPGSYYGKDHFGHAKKGREKRAVPGLEKYHGKDIYLTEALTLEMNAAITESVKAKKPFFAYMSHYAVHAPFQADPRFIKNYTETKGNLASFASMIEGMDKSLGDMLDHLEKLGVAENTIVFFLGDNGTDAPAGSTHKIACSAPLRGKKGTHYEGGMRVPFIAAWAKPNAAHPAQKQTPIAQGVIINNMGAVYDLYPTVLALAGVKSSAKNIDGINLLPILSGKIALAERDFLMHFPHGHRSSYFTSYRKGDWKVIYHYQPGSKEKIGKYELFNLKTDRSESNNLAESNPKELKAMMTALAEKLTETKAQYPHDKEGIELKPIIP